MVTDRNTSNNLYGYSDERADLVGLSTDSKPTTVKNGSTFIEIDTGKKFMYDESGEQWCQIYDYVKVASTNDANYVYVKTVTEPQP